MTVGVINYGMGNIWSVLSALKYLGAKTVLVDKPETFANCEFLVLPGVGSFRKGMMALQDKGLNEAITEAVKSHGIKILGICLGMQLLGSHGTEDGETDGLGLIANRVDRFTPDELGTDNKIPHVGFNRVSFNNNNGLFKGLPDNPDFYFTHSYRMLQEKIKGRIGLCSHGTHFLAAFEVDNICGTQFHPEKSQTNGLILLKNFLTRQ